MKKLFAYRINRASGYFALWSFVLSTIMFLLYTATEAEMLIAPGISILVLYAILITIVFAILTLNALINYKDLKEHVIAFFMVLVSMSIVILYSKILNNF